MNASIEPANIAKIFLSIVLMITAITISVGFYALWAAIKKEREIQDTMEVFINIFVAELFLIIIGMALLIISIK